MRVLLQGFLQRLRGQAAVAGPLPDTTDSPLLSELHKSGLSFEKWFSTAGERLYVDLPDSAISRLKTMRPDTVTETVQAAERVMRHEFSLLGSGPFSPSDPDRPVQADGYLPLDWYLDPVSGLRFPRGIPYKEWKLYEMRPGNADVKLPWELARCQHFAVLGQAYRLTADERYAQEIFHEIADFMEANPVGMGINWTCTMDVAIRALNWAIGLVLVRSCGVIDRRVWQKSFEALFDHGHFIRSNLENTYEVTSNHFLSNVVGLYCLSAVFCELPSGTEWDAFCRSCLEEEIVKQVLEDGADYESSVPYHRLVTELFLGAARLAEYRGQPLSESYMKRLGLMVDFLFMTLRPDGLMPQSGDADDGRMHIFTGYGRWNPQDARHLLGPAAFLLKNDEWTRCLNEDGLWEAAWWGFDIHGADDCGHAPPTVIRLFPDAGLLVAREKGNYLLVSNGIVGTKGFGNHKHNDQLGFEYHLDGKPLFVDPGSYVYTSDFDARNLFRGTAYHNTLMIHGEEQNEMRPEWIFRLFETAHAVHEYVDVKEEHAEYRGRHVGYRRLADPVTHERTFRLLRGKNTLAILDRLDGSGEHVLRWHFHCAPRTEVIRVDETSFRLTTGDTLTRLVLPASLEGHISDAWYSPSYGVKVPCRAIDLACRANLGITAEWLFMVVPEACFTEVGMTFDVAALRNAMARRKEGTVL